MHTKAAYCSILLVFVLLWACQLVVCHMTHSLVILTDSYINLYKILDVSLGLLHLCTQRELAQGGGGGGDGKPASAGRLLQVACTYQFKRLPLLGAFMNGLFLAALLMSAAIEGIQTCVHSGHSGQSAHEESILHREPLTYPLVLVAFAFVGLLMQHCSLKAHEMREEELQSESLLDLVGGRPAAASELPLPLQVRAASLSPVVVMRELSASSLDCASDRPDGRAGRRAAARSLGKRRSYDLSVLQRQADSTPDSPAGGGRQSSLQELSAVSLAGRGIADSGERRVSLKSLKFTRNLESLAPPLTGPIGATVSHHRLQAARPQGGGGNLPHKANTRDNWLLVRYLTSPVALLVYAAINYLVEDELLTEIADASLSICVVVLLFAASYPPMRKAGRLLLQTIPDGLDLARLEKGLLAASPHVLRVDKLHVWSLTPRSNRVATCELVLDRCQVEDAKQIQLILAEARFCFLEQNVKCTTIQPVLGEPARERE